MSKQTVYWVWLQQCIGYASAKVRTVTRFFPSIKDFYEAGEQEWYMSGSFNKKELEKMKSFTLEQAQDIINLAEKDDNKVIDLDNEHYPKKLKEIFDPPAVLYVHGDIASLNQEPSVAMVGTRNSSPEGLKSAFSLGR